MGCLISVFGVEPFRIGGTEAYARELSLQLSTLGWQSVLCFLTEPSKEVASFLDLPNVSIEVLPNVAQEGFRGASDLRRTLSRYKPDILHLHYFGFVGFYPWLSRLYSVDSFFFTDHSSRPAGYLPQRSPFWKRMLVRAINYPVRKVICVSRYGLNCMTALDVLPPDRYAMIYNGVDIKRISPNPGRGRAFRNKLSIPEDACVVLQVSWVIPEKGIGDLLKVSRAVHEHNQKVMFLVVGEGPSRDEYMKQAEEMGVASHFRWAGLIEDPLGEGVYDAADIVCQLSQWEEVFGWMIAESMVYGKPIIATRVGGIPELVQHGESGFLVDRGDISTPADHILRLVADKETRERMGQAGQEFALRKFNLAANVGELIHLYNLNLESAHQETITKE